MADSPKSGQPAPKRRAAAESTPEPLAFRLVRVLGVVVLAFLVGVITTELKSFPYPLFEDAFTALRAAEERRQIEASATRNINFWGVPRSDERGLVIHDAEKASPGYTLYASGHFHGAFLIDMNGDVVHRWELPFRETWPDPPHIDDPVEDRLIFCRRVHMFPNGDLLAQYYGFGTTPYGYGLVKVNRDSELIWKVAENIHHDFDIMPDGTIWTIGQQWRNTSRDPVPDAEHLEERILEDLILAISPDGEVERRFSVIDAIIDGGFPHILNHWHKQRTEDAPWDPLHTNAIAILSAEFASHHPAWEPGMLLISMRTVDALAVVDVETERLVWANRGFWTHQHDPDPLPNGNIMVYDNRGDEGARGMSRLLEFDPWTNEVDWFYRGTEEQPFQGEIRGNQQVLPNDNVLTHEHRFGRIFEITRDGEIVWEFYNPHEEVEEGETLIPAVGSVARYPMGYPSFPLAKPANAGASD